MIDERDLAIAAAALALASLFVVVKLACEIDELRYDMNTARTKVIIIKRGENDDT